MWDPDLSWKFLPPGVRIEGETRKEILRGIGFEEALAPRPKVRGLKELVQRFREKTRRVRTGLKNARKDGVKTSLKNWSTALQRNVRPGYMSAVFIDVALRVLIRGLPWILLIGYAIWYNDSWGWLNVPSTGAKHDDGNWYPPLGWGDFQQPDFGLTAWTQLYILNLTHFIMWPAFISMMGVGVTVIVGFLPDVLPVRIVREMLGLIDLLFTFFFCFCCCQICCWNILAVCIDPQVLPFGTAIVGAIYACNATYNEFISFKEAVQAELAKAYDVLLQVQIKNALSELRMQQILEGESGVLPMIEQEKKYTPSDVFLALSDLHVEEAGYEEGTLTMSDIENMFRIFELNLDENERERFFAYCDIDASGDVTIDEFQAGFDEIFEEKLRSQMAGLGISTAEAVLMAVVSIFIVVCLSIFIIVGLTAYSGAGNFQSLIQSFLISITAAATAKTRKKVNDNPEGIADAILRR